MNATPTERTFFEVGGCEEFKRGYHLAIGALIAGALGYNVVALVKRPTPQLAVNVVL